MSSNNSIKRYSVFCISEAAFFEFHSPTEPTLCPNTHAHDRTIDSGQTTIINEAPIIGKNFETLVPKKDIINTTKFQDLKCDFHFNPLTMDEITNIKIVGFLDGTGSYTVRAFNSIDQSTTISGDLTNTTKQIIDLGYITNSPTEEAIIEFHVRVNSNGEKANIQTVIISWN